MKHVIAAVDDDRRVRESIQDVLESAGYEALAFASAEDLLASDALSRADCVLVDVRLPGISGIDLQRRIREGHPQIPVIFVTAHDDDDVRRQALQGGAIDFMVKPFDAAQLLENIDHVVRNS